MKRQNRRSYKGMILVILAAVLYLAGCGAGQNTAGADKSAAAGGLPRQDMGLLCFYRDEKDESFDSDMEIVEGRIDALTDGRYLREETELETESGSRYAVNFYVPGETYGDYSLLDFSRIYINRPMNLWLSNEESGTVVRFFGENITLPRDAMESVELLEECPDHFNPLDFGLQEGELIYLRITLTEEYCRNNPQIWEWTQPYIRQDIEEYKGSASFPAALDAENHSIIFADTVENKCFLRSLYYTYTHEPLSKGFYVSALPVIEWESGEEIKGAGQIENSEFKTATVLNVYAPSETYVGDKDWEQTMQAIRERLDAAGFPYALGRRVGDDRSVVIRMEDGVFARNFMNAAVQNTSLSFDALGESITESPSNVKATSEIDPNKVQSKVLALDMSAIRKETFYRLSEACVKAGGGRIVLRVNGTAVAYGDCDRIISDGRFVMTYNAYTAESGFESPMEWMPDFLESMISGTPIPMITTYSAAVTLRNKGCIYLSKEGYLWLPSDEYGIPRENFYAEIKNRIGDMDYALLGVLTDGTPCIQFTIPEGETRSEQIAETLIRVFKELKEKILTYGIRIEFIDGNENTVIKVYTVPSSRREDTRLSIWIDYKAPITEDEYVEIGKLLSEDEIIADFATRYE